MFTGLVEETGTLLSIIESTTAAEITVSHEPWSSALQLGESVSVQGACLTVVEASQGSFKCNVLIETFSKTNLSSLKSGDIVNLERAMKVGDRIGGHIVTGHIDGTGKIGSISRDSGDTVIEVLCDSNILEGTVLKGSIAIDGVSLTVTSLTNDSLAVNIIPHTMNNTSLCCLKVGDIVNLESDYLGKYVLKQINAKNGHELTIEDLRKAGFAS